ncbi:MAG: ATP-binding protein [Pirellulaceae bacterium]
MLDPAVIGRPSRFDVVIEITVPDSAARLQILERQLEKLAEIDVVNSAVELTAGLSGAQVKEVAILACQKAIEEECEPGELAVHHFHAALKGLHRNRKSKVGFHS